MTGKVKNTTTGYAVPEVRSLKFDRENTIKTNKKRYDIEYYINRFLGSSACWRRIQSRPSLKLAGGKAWIYFFHKDDTDQWR
jgi:hypothetical protein